MGYSDEAPFPLRFQKNIIALTCKILLGIDQIVRILLPVIGPTSTRRRLPVLCVKIAQVGRQLRQSDIVDVVIKAVGANLALVGHGYPRRFREWHGEIGIQCLDRSDCS